jgi:hypothetical protein
MKQIYLGNLQDFINEYEKENYILKVIDDGRIVVDNYIENLFKIDSECEAVIQVEKNEIVDYKTFGNINLVNLFELPEIAFFENK